MSDALDLLKLAIHDCDGFVELRYHSKLSRNIAVEKGKLEKTVARRRLGVGVRVLEKGGWGFASTGNIDRSSISQAIQQARKAALVSAPLRSERASALPKVKLAKGDFSQPGVDEVVGRPLEEKLGMTRLLEERIRAAGSSISSASCAYTESLEEKAIVTTDGAAASFRLVRPEIRLQAVAEKDGVLSSGYESVGVTGGWDCLFLNGSGEFFADKAARTATDLLGARRPQGGRATVIMSPSIVGLLVHEAIGHTVEADFVQAGSVAAGKLGQRVGSDLVNLCDSGASEFAPGAGGTIPVDDEGVVAAKTTIIRNGILASYLHNRESAARFGVQPTGNARAWEYA
ncbi:MAG: TldD/PmbA family protein, partial [Candidatus Binatia bacterium]